MLPTLLIQLILILRIGAAADLQLSDFADQNLPQSAYRGFITEDGHNWPLLKRKVEVELKDGAGIFAHADAFLTPGAAANCAAGADLDHGRLVFAEDDLVAVKFDKISDGCAAALGKDSDTQLFFVKASDIESVYTGRRKAKTQPPCDKICHNPGTLKKIDTATGRGSQEKNNDQLEEYLSCYATPNQDNYNRYYKKLIELAGQTFQLSYFPGERNSVKAILDPDKDASPADGGKKFPFLVTVKPKVMKCLVLRESRWDPLAESETGATGLGQQTEINVKSIKCLIAGCTKTYEVAGGHGKGKKVVSETVEPEKWAQQVWKAYFSKAKEKFSAEEWKELTTNRRTKAPCTETMEVKSRDAVCPLNSLAAFAVEQLALELQMRKMSPLYKDSDQSDFSPEEADQLILVQGSSHDAGIGKAAASVRSNPNPKDWGNALVRVPGDPNREKELRDYKQYLNNCLTRDNWNPMGPGKAKTCKTSDFAN